MPVSKTSKNHARENLAFALSWALWIPADPLERQFGIPKFKRRSGARPDVARCVGQWSQKESCPPHCLTLLVPLCWIEAIFDLGAKCRAGRALASQSGAIPAFCDSACIAQEAFSRDSGSAATAFTEIASGLTAVNATQQDLFNASEDRRPDDCVADDGSHRFNLL